MPDITHQTVSASQAAALFNQSPYLTRWMLFQHFANGMPIEAGESDRLDWGRRLEPPILRAAADQLRCDIIGNTDYFRHPVLPIGATGDGFVLDPQRGLGILECKNVDYLRWRDTWTDTEAAPHVEIQVQTQLAIPHPEYGAPKWGCIAVLVGGNDLKLYQREVLPDVQNRIASEATAFLDSVRNNIEPEVAGRSIELAGLHWAVPRVDREKVLREDAFSPQDAFKLARLIEEFHDHKARISVSKASAEDLQAQIEAMIGDAAEVIVHQRRIKVSRSEIAGRTQIVKPYTMVRMTPAILEFAGTLAEIEPRDPAFDLPPNIFV